MIDIGNNAIKLMHNAMTSPHRKLILKGERNTKFLMQPDCSNLFAENLQTDEIENKLVCLNTIYFLVI